MHSLNKIQRVRQFLNHKAKIANGMRIVCLSDTHCRSDDFKVPDGDVLIIAGDVCLRGSLTELQTFDAFLGQLPHKHKLFVAGNHDFPFAYVETAKAKTLLKNAIYLENSGGNFQASCRLS